MSSGGSVSSSPVRSSISAALMGSSSVAAAAVGGDDYHFPADLISVQDRKDEALRVLKSDLIATLSKEVKSLDEDSWMFDGPRSRIHLISRPGSEITLLSPSDQRSFRLMVLFYLNIIAGGLQLKSTEISKHDRMAPPK